MTRDREVCDSRRVSDVGTRLEIMTKGTAKSFSYCQGNMRCEGCRHIYIGHTPDDVEGARLGMTTMDKALGSYSWESDSTLSRRYKGAR